jgi:hypothetical protein
MSEENPKIAMEKSSQMEAEKFDDAVTLQALQAKETVKENKRIGGQTSSKDIDGVTGRESSSKDTSSSLKEPADSSNEKKTSDASKNKERQPPRKPCSDTVVVSNDYHVGPQGTKIPTSKVKLPGELTQEQKDLERTKSWFLGLDSRDRISLVVAVLTREFNPHTKAKMKNQEQARKHAKMKEQQSSSSNDPNPNDYFDEEDCDLKAFTILDLIFQTYGEDYVERLDLPPSESTRYIEWEATKCMNESLKIWKESNFTKDLGRILFGSAYPDFGIKTGERDISFLETTAMNKCADLAAKKFKTLSMNEKSDYISQKMIVENDDENEEMEESEYIPGSQPTNLSRLTYDDDEELALLENENEEDDHQTSDEDDDIEKHSSRKIRFRENVRTPSHENNNPRNTMVLQSVEDFWIMRELNLNQFKKLMDIKEKEISIHGSFNRETRISRDCKNVINASIVGLKDQHWTKEEKKEMVWNTWSNRDFFALLKKLVYPTSEDIDSVKDRLLNLKFYFREYNLDVLRKSATLALKYFRELESVIEDDEELTSLQDAIISAWYDQIRKSSLSSHEMKMLMEEIRKFVSHKGSDINEFIEDILEAGRIVSAKEKDSKKFINLRTNKGFNKKSYDDDDDDDNDRPKRSSPAFKRKYKK